MEMEQVKDLVPKGSLLIINKGNPAEKIIERLREGPSE